MMDYSCGPDSVTIRIEDDDYGRSVEMFLRSDCSLDEFKKELRRTLRGIEAVQGREWFNEFRAAYKLPTAA